MNNGLKLKTTYKRILFAIILFLFVFLLLLIIFNFYNKYRIAHAIVRVELVNNLDIEVYSNVELKDLIVDINGELLDNYNIDTTKLGPKKIDFEYVNEEKITIPYSFEINVVDETPPIISRYQTKEVYVGDKDFKDTIFCGDNYDNEPKCTIKGEYDINTPGTYPLTFIGEDSSNNISTQNFNLIVKEKPKTSSSKRTTSVDKFKNSVDIKNYISKYKTKKTKIGIDVSHWQGNIDYKEVKKQGVEFAIIRVGARRGIDGELYLDEKFEQNIKGFNEVGIPVGVYFFSYAKDKKQAKEEAKFVIKNIKKYDVELPIAFDWENFDSYREFNLSFHSLTDVANEFMNYVDEKGYDAMLYGSKYPLEEYWYETDYKTWLAHYTEQTDYKKDKYLWQLTSNGRVKGIEDNVVDINIMYK